MSIEKLRRVIWRLEELNKPKVTEKEVRRAVMHEIGTDESTLEKNINKLVELGWLTRENTHTFVVGTM